MLALDRALAPPSVLDLALAALLATDRRAGQQWDGARASTRPRALRAVSEVGVRHMDGVGAEPRAVRALEAWLRPPLIPWQALRQLQETQREIEALQRGDTKSGSAEERAWSSRFSAAGDGVVVVPSEQLSDGRCTVLVTQDYGGVQRASSRRCSRNCRRLNGHAGYRGCLGHQLTSLPTVMNMYLIHQHQVG